MSGECNVKQIQIKAEEEYKDQSKIQEEYKEQAQYSQKVNLANQKTGLEQKCPLNERDQNQSSNIKSFQLCKQKQNDQYGLAQQNFQQLNQLQQQNQQQPLFPFSLYYNKYLQQQQGLNNYWQNNILKSLQQQYLQQQLQQCLLFQQRKMEEDSDQNTMTSTEIKNLKLQKKKYNSDYKNHPNMGIRAGFKEFVNVLQCSKQEEQLQEIFNLLTSQLMGIVISKQLIIEIYIYLEKVFQKEAQIEEFYRKYKKIEANQDLYYKLLEEFQVAYLNQVKDKKLCKAFNSQYCVRTQLFSLEDDSNEQKFKKTVLRVILSLFLQKKLKDKCFECKPKYKKCIEITSQCMLYDNYQKYAHQLKFFRKIIQKEN